MKAGPSESLHFRRTIVQILAIIAIFVALFALYMRWEQQVDSASEARQRSFSLSNELRQTSNDLSRMVASYIATGDLRYKRYYQDILAIRNGTVGRPLAYSHVYWDLVVSGEAQLGERGPPVALQELMRRSGFSAGELAKLAEAQSWSDALTRTEHAAMARYEAAESERAEALRMLYDGPYLQAKARIMRPIQEFQQMMDARTRQAVELAQRTAMLVRAAFIGFGVMLVLTQWRAYRTLHTVLGCNLDELYGHILRLGRDEQGSSAPQGRDSSVKAWLVSTQAELQRQDAKRQRLEQELRKLAYHDALTQLPNRRQLLDRLKYAVAASKRHCSHGAVLFIDLNRFKQLNDSHGHDVGDRLLVAVARRLQQVMRDSDTVARLGGDEFVVVLEDLGPDAERAAAHAERVADKIAVALADDYQLGTIRHQGSASVGISLFLGDAADPDAILKAADAAMYHRKKQRAA